MQLQKAFPLMQNLVDGAHRSRDLLSLVVAAHHTSTRMAHVHYFFALSFVSLQKMLVRQLLLPLRCSAAVEEEHTQLVLHFYLFRTLLRHH
jgi:hypothetical protein